MKKWKFQLEIIVFSNFLIPSVVLGSPKPKETDFNWKYDSTKTESQYVLEIIRHPKCDFFSNSQYKLTS
ncbi:MAG: hypothetical protein CMB25_02625 [Euryarchaeota archaeon]|nr:hypothetical protein [Euryarchaeota archaeon]